MKYPTTSKTLIDKLPQGDSNCWNEFYDRYHAIIREVGLAKGLTDDECKDLVQEVMLRFFRLSNTFKFDPAIAKFRTYFGKIISGKIVDIMRRRITTFPDAPKNEAEHDDKENSPDVIVDKMILEKWRALMFDHGKKILRSRINPKTYLAFELYAEQGRDIKRVADTLEMTPNQIYVAKNRCVKALCEILTEFNETDPELGLQTHGI